MSRADLGMSEHSVPGAAAMEAAAAAVRCAWSRMCRIGWESPTIIGSWRHGAGPPAPRPGDAGCQTIAVAQRKALPTLREGGMTVRTPFSDQFWTICMQFGKSATNFDIAAAESCPTGRRTAEPPKLPALFPNCMHCRLNWPEKGVFHAWNQMVDDWTITFLGRNTYER